MENLHNKNLTGRALAQWLKENIVGQELISIKSATPEQRELLDNPGNEVYVIELANGYNVLIDANEGCGGCQNGWAEFSVEQDGAGVVTCVEFEDLGTAYSEEFRVFIYLENQPTIKFSGDDGVGNGFYGYGFYVTVKGIETKENN